MIEYIPPENKRKKGKKSWKPATQLETLGRDPDFVYRYVRDEPERMQKMEREQWELCNRVTDKSAHIDEHEEHDAVTGGMKYRELVLMRMPKSTAKQRNAYYQQRATHQERDLKAELESELKKEGGEVSGSLTID